MLAGGGGGCKHMRSSNLHLKNIKNIKNKTELGGGEGVISQLGSFGCVCVCLHVMLCYIW